MPGTQNSDTVSSLRRPAHHRLPMLRMRSIYGFRLAAKPQIRTMVRICPLIQFISWTLGPAIYLAKLCSRV